MEMVKLSIDGKEITAEKGSTILEAARQYNIEIPTLCYHEAVKPFGACRLCVVEIKKGKKSRIVTSCNYFVEDGLEVLTNTERVLRVRRLVIELLLARCPNVKIVRELAEKLGVEDTTFTLDNSFCILCGLCVRVCDEVVGAKAISFANRGIYREVTSPFLEPAEDCIGCGSCVYVCPTGLVTMKDVMGARFYTPDGDYELGNLRIMHNWKQSLRLAECKKCGRPFMPQAQIDFIAKKTGISPDELKICPTCKE